MTRLFGYRRIAAFAALGILLAAPALAQAAAPAAAAPPAAPAPSCHPIVRMYGQLLCEEQLQPEKTDLSRGLRSTGGAGQMYEAQRQARNLDRLKDMVWQAALIHKFGAAAVNPTLEEIDSYRKAMDGVMQGSYEADKKMAAMVEDLLAKNQYSPANEQRLRQLLNAAQLSIRAYDARQTHTADLPKQFQFVVDTAERQIALDQLTVWKDDKALYNAYGGRLVLTQNGLQPVDAYRKFFAYIQSDAHLEILDPAYKDVLKAIKDHIDGLKETPANSPQLEMQYFSSPTWQFQLANSDTRLAAMKTQLDKIPTLGPKAGAPASAKDMVGKQSLPPAPEP